MREFGRVRILALTITLAILMQLQPTAVRGTEAAPESPSTTETDSHWPSILFGLDGGLGSYQNVTRQRGDPPSRMENGSYAGFLNPEFGLEAFGLAITCDWDMILSPTGTYIGTDESQHQASSSWLRIKAVYALRNDKFHLLPEFGYVFIGEDASIYSASHGPDSYSEEYEDQNYCYGLSARARIKPWEKAHWWLYARYAHDNLDIQVDNYQIALQVGDEYSGVPDPDWVGPDVKSAYFSLGVRCSKKTDGRSEWFITLGLTGTIGIL